MRKHSSTDDDRPRPLLMGLSLAILLAPTHPAYADTIYRVDTNAPGPVHDGTSWATAYTDLQDALGNPSLGSGDQVWVAEGTYIPSSPSTPSERHATFSIPQNIKLRGGYAGFGATDPDARDVDAYLTVLSGDRGDVGDETDNCYHVVKIFFATAATHLDGFTITHGYAHNGECDDLDPLSWGGGAYIFMGCPTVMDCTFTGNSACAGGGVFSGGEADTVFINCVFIGNEATSDSRLTLGGGGLLSASAGDVELYNCTFFDNHATGSNGGGLWLGWGMGSKSPGMSFQKLVNCTIVDNSASYCGGGIFVVGSVPELYNCVLWGNTDCGQRCGPTYGSNCTELAQLDDDSQDRHVEEGEQGQGPMGTFTIDYSCLEGWSESYYSGTGTIGGAPGHNPLFFGSGDLHLQPSSPCINTGDATELPDDDWDLDGDQDTDEDLPLDLDGAPRVNGIIDMGVYEYADCNSNDIPDVCDFTCDGHCDDYPGCGESHDCDGDNIPDECDSCPWDLSGNGTVDPYDLGLLKSHYGCNVALYPCECGVYDLSGDGYVNPIDVGVLKQNYGPCP